MEKPLLNDPAVHPDSAILKEALGESFPAFELLMDTVMSPEYGLIPEWRYYRDGGAWLCKVIHKKKTVFFNLYWFV